MEGDSILAPKNGQVILEIGRAYSAENAACFLGITVFVLNQRVREGQLQPVFNTGDRRYSGYVLARLLGWPLSDDPRDYMPRKDPVEGGKIKRRVRVVR